MKFLIDNNNIEKSFDAIAKEILNKHALFINDQTLLITEIEFYYFHEDFHTDQYTHKHMRKEGEWRFHNQGLDITFKGDEKSDGGILIRGIFDGRDFINGPRNIIVNLFQHFSKVTDVNTFILKATNERHSLITKTFRHLPNTEIYPEFHNKFYRYLINLDDLQILESIKNEIRNRSVTISE